LIIVVIGFLPLTRPEANLLFRMISHRYLTSSAVTTTNKSIKE
jgi:DNA replication protein DnaC